MGKNIFKKNTFFSLALAFISWSNSNASYATFSEEEPSLQSNGWHVSNVLENFFSYGSDFIYGTGVPLNRRISIKPDTSDELVKEIRVLKYRDNHMVVRIDLRKKVPNLFEDLYNKNLINFICISDQLEFCSEDENRLDEFLEIFTKRKLIPLKVAEDILKSVKE